MKEGLPALLLGIGLGASAVLGVWWVREQTKTPCPCKETK